MKIARNTVAYISYKLYSNDEENELIEETEVNEPFSFLFGHNEVLNGVEDVLKGLSEGDSFEIELSAADAFGEENEDFYHEFPKSHFMVDGELNEELLEEGEVVPMEDGDGNEIYGVIAENKLNSVVIDFNHPLAGVDIRYEGVVEKVRTATDSEIEKGTVE